MGCRIFTLLILVLLSGCKLPYKPDLGMMSDGFANAPTAIVKINDQLCKGGCYVIAKRNQVIKLDLLPIGFNYRIDLLSSTNYGYEKSFDVIGEKGLSLELPGSSVDVFNLLGRFYPQEPANETATIFFEARFRLYDEAYIPRVTPYIQQGFLIFGEDARFVNCEGKLLNKATTVKKCDQGFSVSESMRVNSYGY